MIEYSGELPRANFARTGVYPTQGVSELTGVKWQFQGEASSDGLSRPCVTRQGLVCCCSQSAVYVLDKDSGRVIWKRPGMARWPLLLAENILFIERDGGRMNAVDLFSGENLWHIECGPVLQWPTLCDDVAFLVQDSEPGKNDGCVLSAFEARTGRVRWKFQMEDSYSITSQITLRNSLLFFFAEGGSHSGSPLYALDSVTGKVQWQSYDMPLAEIALLLGRRLFYSDNSGSLIGLNAKTGEKEWEYDWEDKEDEDEWAGAIAASPPAATDDMLFFRTMNDPLLCAVDRRKKRLRWTQPLPEDWSGESQAPPSVADGKVYCAVGSTLYVFVATSGRPLWHFTAQYPVTSEVVIDNAVAYFASGNRLYALH